jgi:hypothetical protein
MESKSNQAVTLLNETHALSRRLADITSLDTVNDEVNIGKRIEKCVSATLLLDTFNAFDEYCRVLENRHLEAKVSSSLLTRYIFESYVTYLYIFNVSKPDKQVRTKAFFHFGNYKKSKMQSKNDLGKHEQEWKKYIPKKGSRTQWHGRSFQEIACEVNYTPVIYQVLSQFTHPGIFTLERVLNTEMFRGIIDDSIIFTSAAICDMMNHVYKSKLHGLKQHPKNKIEVERLVKRHNQVLSALKAK